MVKKYGIWVLILLFGLLYSLYSVVRHLRLESLIFDLGVYDQIIWLASRGKPLFSSILESHAWGDHFTPTLLLLAPLYWVWDNAIILLLFQAFFASFGAYPIYLLARKKLKDNKLALLLAFAYLYFFGIQEAIVFDFHPIVLATTLIAWMFWLYEEKKFKLFWLLLILVLGLQENLFLFIAAFGVFLILKYRDFKRGLFILVSNTIFFLLVIFLVIPFFGKAQFTYLPIHFKSLDFVSAIKMMFFPLSKVRVMLASLIAFGGLPIFSPAIFVILLEEFVQRFIGTPIDTRWSIYFQYNAILAPVLAFGAISAIQKYFAKKRILAATLLIAGAFLATFPDKPGILPLLKKDFYDLSKTKDAKQVLAVIPANASLAATNNLGAQLTHRQNIIFLTNCIEDSRTWKVDVKRCYQLKPDYLLADFDPGSEPNNYYPDDSRESLKRYFDYLLNNGKYRIEKQQGMVFLLKKND